MPKQRQQIPPFVSSFPQLVGIPSGILYHYTTFETAQRILGTLRLLMTHWKDFAHHPNGDVNEILWAANQYDRYIRPLYGPHHIVTAEQVMGDMYVLSSCAHPNNAHLWQRYAEQGDGVAIGIDARTLYEWWGGYEGRRSPSFLGIARMDYDTARYAALCAESVKDLAPFDWSILQGMRERGELSAEDIENSTNTLINYVPGYAAYVEKRRNVLGLISLQKDAHYSVEEETRIIHDPTLLHSALPLDVNRYVPWQRYSRAVLPLVHQQSHCVAEVVMLSGSGDERSDTLRDIIDNHAMLEGVKIRQLNRAKIVDEKY